MHFQSCLSGLNAKLRRCYVTFVQILVCDILSAQMSSFWSCGLQQWIWLYQTSSSVHWVNWNRVGFIVGPMCPHGRKEAWAVVRLQAAQTVQAVAISDNHSLSTFGLWHLTTCSPRTQGPAAPHSPGFSTPPGWLGMGSLYCRQQLALHRGQVCLGQRCVWHLILLRVFSE